MKYSELFTLNPITTVIQIDQADKKAEAKKLVSTFVITPSLGDAIETVALPQLDFENAAEGKGIFVVGNYGTGKSHVMSFLSIIAEDDSYLPSVHSDHWRERLSGFAGKYKVKRCQIAASMMNLYQIVAEQLSLLATSCGFDFTFKDQRQISNVKDEFQRFMVAFDAACPGKGVLLIVDELLHFLQSRNDADLVLDLSVLQALGEFSDKQRFAFIAGLQQSLFQNPKFNHVASDLNRVKQRFYDFVIDSKGVGQLIEQYLFQKDASHREEIKALLMKQAPLYEIVGAEIDQFTRLFPAHPSFISEFERVFVVERREILTVLSQEARKLADVTVDPDSLDLITSDKYWDHIDRDKGLDANRDVQQIKQNVATLRARIQTDFPATDDVAAAERLVKALAVNRLTTPSINDEVGLKPEELKNRLLWKTKIPMESASFLTSAAKRLLDNTRKAANGQFLTVSETSGQYFIDPKRVVDYDQDVATTAIDLGKQVVQRYLNEIVTRALELDNEQPVLENRLWNYDLMWAEHNVERPGWLFFGFPNQRSTAKPPRDFYIFLIPSERITGLKEPFSSVADEIYVMFEDFPPAKCDSPPGLKESDPDAFLDTLRKYAAARERESTCRPGDEKTAFKSIADRHLKTLAPALVDNAAEWLTVVWNGQRKKFGAWVLELDPIKVTATFKTKVDSIAQIMFSQHFQAKYPDYPTFTIKIQEKTRRQNCSSALEIICKAGLTTNIQGKAVLNALGLYKDETPTPDQSPWLEAVRTRLNQVGVGQNLNHSDLFERRDDKDWWIGQNIEAEWLHVVLAAGIEAGDLVVIGPQGRRYDASNLSAFYTEIRSYAEIVNVAKPMGIPIDAWKKLFQAFNLKTGLLANPSTYDDAIRDFQTAVQGRISDLVLQEQGLLTPLPYVDDGTQAEIAGRLPIFNEVKTLLETSLVPINTKARMQNLKLGVADIDELSGKLKTCSALGAILGFIKANNDDLSAIQRLENVLGTSSGDVAKKREALEEALNDLYVFPDRLSSESATITALIQSTKEVALKSYHALHKQYRLDKEGDKKKGAIVGGTQLKQLNRLTQIDVLPAPKLEEWRQTFDSLRFCGGCTDAELVKDALSLCPRCKFDPKTMQGMSSATDLLDKCEANLSKLHAAWTSKLLQEISDPSVVSTLNALKREEYDEITQFMGYRKLPDTITDAFIQGINTALKGVKRKNITSVAFATAVIGDGTPLKPEELQQRFETWLKDQIGDDDPNTVRFMLES